ncbi:MAG: DctP family TRAP transporter solute-binding subunit [Kerstersia gyiorum]|jgi:tripartite ATP-independent transporter DctP family solute receptor|uniref:DctP family TRAP transporter solute-binding subunit n=1 Tax=Kerstersia gyiorum TaxID=206506 RepID=UPI00242E1E11|nr:DctP family TRAP transporter solute-binding subunit [Kerstersia gyiorum]MCH4271376.1 DctP family TRAP transporter solute-binding subunit [Kerstersia gyiorum]
MKSLFSLAAIPAVVLPLLAGVAGSAEAADYKQEYRLSTNVNEVFPLGRGAQEWARLVTERTDGRINVKWYPGSSLVGGETTREFTALRQGGIDFNVSSVINWSPHVKELNLFLLPFLVPDDKAFDALTSGEVADELFEIVKKRGVVPLAWGENGAREISNSKHEIRTPDDLKGLKFRVVGSPIFNDIYTALGANPTQMTFADAQPALQSGVVDGQENPISLFVGAKMHTLGQKYLTKWNYVNDPLVFAVSAKAWESWSPEDQEIVRQAAQEAARNEIAATRKGVSPGDDALIQQAIGQGVQVTILSDAEKAAFAEATRPVVEKWSRTIGEDLVRKAQQEVAATR